MVAMLSETSHTLIYLKCPFILLNVLYCFVSVAQSGCLMSISQYSEGKEMEMRIGGEIRIWDYSSSSLRAGRNWLQLTPLIKVLVILQW